MKNFSGVGVALVTPFTKSGEVDFEALTSLLYHVEDVDYYVVLGTTAESVTLSAEERRAVVEHVVAFNKGIKPVVVGVGGNNTAEVVRQLQEFSCSGVDAILSVVPYYNKPTQAGIYAHYAEVLNNSPLPVILYNVPGRTGVNMSAETTLRLANDFKGKAIAVKEASGNLGQVVTILEGRPKGFLVISGDDNLTLPMLSIGGDGVISVSANAFAHTMAEMNYLAKKNDFHKASRLSLKLWRVTDLLFKEGNPAGVKAALELQKVMTSEVRLPLVKASDELKSEIAVEISKYDLI